MFKGRRLASFDLSIPIERLRYVYCYLKRHGQQTEVFDIGAWYRNCNPYQVNIYKKQGYQVAKKHSCGTAACLAGQIPFIPKMAELGVRVKTNGEFIDFGVLPHEFFGIKGGEWDSITRPSAYIDDQYHGELKLKHALEHVEKVLRRYE